MKDWQVGALVGGGLLAAGGIFYLVSQRPAGPAGVTFIPTSGAPEGIARSSQQVYSNPAGAVAQQLANTGEAAAIAAGGAAASAGLAALAGAFGGGGGGDDVSTGDDSGDESD